MSDISLKQLMEQEMNPKAQDLRARFHNAQIAVDIAYRLAERHTYVPDTKTPNPDWKEGDREYDRFIYTEATSEMKATELTKLARLLKVGIEKDLNDTLKVLEVVADGAKANTTKLS